MEEELIYLFDGEHYETEEEVNEAVREYAERTYDDMLDDCYPMAVVCGHEYRPSNALKHLDPIAYRCGIDDYEQYLHDDIETVEREEELDYE